MLGPTSFSTSALDQFRRLLSRPAVESKPKDEDEKRAEAAEKRNLATEARNFLDDQGNPQTATLNTVSKAASGGDEQRKAALKEKLRMLVEQLKSLLQFAAHNPAMAKALAQLSREIASVAKQLGGSSPGVPTATAAAPAATPAATAAAEEAAAGAEGAQAAAATPAAAGAQAENGQAETGQQEDQSAAAAKTAETAESGDTPEDAEKAGEADETAGDETTMPTSAEAAAAKGQALMDKINGEKPKDESDPALKELLTKAKAYLRQAKAMIEEMAKDAQRAGKSDTFEEERKDAAEAITAIEKIDTGGNVDLAAGSVVSLIA